MSKAESDGSANSQEGSHQNGNDNPLFGLGAKGRFIRSGIEVASGIGLYAFGDDCTNWGFIYWGYFFHYSCIVLAALAPVEHAVAVWPKKKKKVWLWYLVSCVLLACFYVKSSWPKPPPLPPLPQTADIEMGLRVVNTFGLPVIPLVLSNNYFRYRWKPGPYQFKTDDCYGFVVFPTVATQPFLNPSPISFQFVLTNCSSVNASNVVIKFTGATNAVWQYASGWNEAVFDEDEESSNKHMEFSVPNANAHTTTFAPMVVFAQSNIFTSFGEMLVAGENVDPHWLRFHVHALITNQKPLPNPYTVKAKKTSFVFSEVTNVYFDDTFPLVDAIMSNAMQNSTQQHP